MTGEREPAPRRKATYQGDRRHLLDDGYAALVGPDLRGIAWLPCHVDYNTDSDTSHVIFRPVADYELRSMIDATLREENKQ